MLRKILGKGGLSGISLRSGANAVDTAYGDIVVYMKAKRSAKLRTLIRLSFGITISTDMVVLDFAPTLRAFEELAIAGDPFRYFQVSDHRATKEIARLILSRTARRIHLFAREEQRGIASELCQHLVAMGTRGLCAPYKMEVTVSNCVRFWVFAIFRSIFLTRPSIT